MQTDANLRRRLSFRFENHFKSPLKIEKEKTASINNKRNMRWLICYFLSANLMKWKARIRGVQFYY